MMPSAPQPPEPTPDPEPAPAAPKCVDTGTRGTAGVPVCSIQYSGAQDNLLVPVEADLAHAEGFTGKGVRVGVLDDTRVPGYAPLEGAIAWERSYLDAGAPPVQNAGHGTLSATGVAGRPTPGFTGGVAPDARLFYGAVCDASGCHADLASQAIRDMGAAGVRIFNASYGNSSAGGLDEDAARRTAFWYRPLLQIDGLLVSSAGNGYGQQPAVMAGMPVVDPDFVGHTIIAVAGDVDADGQVTRLANYSNVCGFAAQWCITAPGLLRQPPLEGTRYQAGSRGTSNAAPIVAGAAALVLEAYPWMSARNLQQTLLTTATDLGDPGVDAAFGWGLLNAHKAVLGPASFQGADFQADVPGGRAVFFNDIGGDRGLVKRGAGALELVGANTYAGETVVRGGELVAMSGFGGPVTVHGAATLTTAGRIRGDFNAQRGAVTGITIGRPLTVDGVATLAGTVRLLAPASTRAIGSTEPLLSATSVRGAFETVRYGSGFFYDARLSYTSTEVSATLTRASASVMSLQSLSPERVVEGAQQADALFGFVDALPTDADAALVTAAEHLAGAPTAEEAELALAGLTGEVHGTARAAAMSLAVSQAQLFGDRVATLNADAAGVWVQATSLDAAFDRDGFASADIRHHGLAMGVDRDFDGRVIGAAIDSGRGRGTLDAVGGRYDSDHVGASLYGRTSLASGYLAGSVGVARYDIDTRRALLLDGQLSEVDGRHQDHMWSARLEAGRAWGAFTPFLAGGYVRHQQGAMSESGGEGLGLAAGADTATIHFGELGARFAFVRGRLTLRGLASARWTGGETRPTYAATFANAPEVDVEIHGQRVPGRGVRGMVGADYRTGRQTVWNLGVAGEQGTGDSGNLSVTGGVQVSF